MIYLYRLVFFCSLFLALSSLLLPSRSGLPIERRLLMRLDEWSLTFNTPDRQSMGLSEENAKNRLLQLLREKHSEKTQPHAWLFPIALTSAFFSFVGWRRELYFEKRGYGRADRKEKETI